jgi:hypothetical protein
MTAKTDGLPPAATGSAQGAPGSAAAEPQVLGQQPATPGGAGGQPSIDTPTLSQRQVNSIMAQHKRELEELKAGFSTQLAELEAKLAQQPSPPSGGKSKSDDSKTDNANDAALEELRARFDASERAREFAERASTMAHLDDAQRQLYRRLLDHEKPKDVAKWIADNVPPPPDPANGTGTANGTAAASAQTSQQHGTHQQPGGAAASQAPAALDDLDRARMNPNKLSAEQVSSMDPMKLREFVRKNLGAM